MFSRNEEHVCEIYTMMSRTSVLSMMQNHTFVVLVWRSNKRKTKEREHHTKVLSGLYIYKSTTSTDTETCHNEGYSYHIF